MSENATQTLTKKDFVSDQEVRWCPGCGDYAILSSVQKVFPDLGIPKENFLIVSGIGCSSRFPYYMDTYGFHSIHGRAPAVASGAKLANPKLSVWVVTGDGDSMSIGGNHFIHVLRRNIDLNILMFNNQIYGLTKGQYSPTSELGKVTKSTPMGSLDYPFNPPQLALGSNGTFIARTIDRDQKHLGTILKEAHLHKGTSFIEIYQNCNIFNDGAFSELTDKETKPNTQLVLRHGEPMTFGLENQKGLKLDGSKFVVINIGDKFSKDDALIHDKYDRNLGMLLSGITYTPNLPVPIGILYQEEKPSYEELLNKQIDESIKSRGKGNLQKTLLGTNHWTVD
tara:strand:- start:2290 stop:3306 length:1017 start_codon:yes stop_codon:yes gene_type:complete